jgi:hypothetical protein
MPLVQALDPMGIDIDTQHIVADFGEYRTLDEANITDTKNCDFHSVSR